MSNIRTLLAAALLASAGNAVAASSVDLSVKGTITPSACTPAIANNGSVDLGKLAAKDLNLDTNTYLPTQYVAVTVTCEAPTFVALEGKDNRAGSSHEEGAFGLGMNNGTEKLGSYDLMFSDGKTVADGIVVSIIGSLDNGSTWGSTRFLETVGIISVADTGSLVPKALQTLSTVLLIRTTVAPAKTLTLTNEVALNGSMTVTVHYL